MSLKKNRKADKNKYKWKWIATVFILSLVITVVLSALSSLINISGGRGFFAAVGMLIAFMVIGVIFDIIALAIATADEKPFHSMAAHGVKSAKHAIKLIRNAERLVSFFSDVIGDIVGIISGSMGAAIAAAMFISVDFDDFRAIAGSLLITGLIAAFTIGGKAFGKSIAISYNGRIVNIVSKIVYFFSRKKEKK